MTMTRWPNVVDAIVTLMAAQSGYRQPVDDSVDEADVLLCDGPEIELTADTGQRVLIIGGTLDVDGDDHGSAGQSLATISTGQTRDDQGFVVCQALAMYGSAELALPTYAASRDTFKNLRAVAFSMLDDLDTVIKNNRTLGISAPRMFATIGDTIVPRQYQTVNGGAVVSVVFTVRYETRV